MRGLVGIIATISITVFGFHIPVHGLHELRYVNGFLPHRFRIVGSKERLVSPAEIGRAVFTAKPLDILAHFGVVLGIRKWPKEASRAQTISGVLFRYPLFGFSPNARKIQTDLQIMQTTLLSWLFPEHSKTGRTNMEMWKLATVMAMINAMLTVLLQCKNKPHVRVLMRGFAPSIQKAFYTHDFGRSWKSVCVALFYIETNIIGVQHQFAIYRYLMFPRTSFEVILIIKLVVISYF